MSKISRICVQTSLLLALSGSVTRAQDADFHGGERSLDERQVVELAIARQPGLKAAMSQLESARWNLNGEEGRFGATLVLDGSYSRNTSPQLFLTGTSISTTKRVDAGAELRKHLIYGTDLALRVAGNWMELEGKRNVALTNPGMGATTGGTASFASPAGKYGPGAGFLGKISLTQPLLRGAGRTVGVADLETARAQRSQAEQTRDRVASELLRDALTAYWELWYADQALTIQGESKMLAQRERDDALARAQSGSLAAADVLTFDTQVSQLSETVLDAKAQRQQAEHELRRLLGLVDARTGLHVLSAEPRVPEPMSPEQAERDALGESRTLGELKAALELARVQARTAADPLRARLDLSSWVQLQGLGNLDPKGDYNKYGNFSAISAFVGLTYEQPLDSRMHRAAAAKARISVEVAEEQLADARDQELSALRVSLDQQTAQIERLLIIEQTVQIAERQLAAEQARYGSGSSTPLAVVQAEDSVRTAKLRVARVHADLLETSLGLEHTRGRLLERYTRELHSTEP
jgi:outer membrane protein